MYERRLLPILPEGDAPLLPFFGLDTLWMQLTGTLCNIACRHCFITCGPKEDRVPMMTRERIEELLLEAAELGVKEFYFTGGEPMLHPDFLAIVERTLQVGPTHVLTNGMLIDRDKAQALRKLFDAARYSLDMRVSLDGMTEAETIRCVVAGPSQRLPMAFAGWLRWACRRSSPWSSTPMRCAWPRRAASFDFARSLGLPQPRVKFLPLCASVASRAGPVVTATMTSSVTLCPMTSCAACSATTRGSPRRTTCSPVHSCSMRRMLSWAVGWPTSLRPIHLRWSACHTCVQEGLSCRT